MMINKKLFIKAEEAMKNAYAPYSDFKVGAAVLTKEGKVYTGCNIENSAYGDSICAERVAISKAVSEGYREIEAIAVAGSEGNAFPCGSCRQFIFEFGGDIKVIVGTDSDHLEEYTVDELLPHGFRLENR